MLLSQKMEEALSPVVSLLASQLPARTESKRAFGRTRTERGWRGGWHEKPDWSARAYHAFNSLSAEEVANATRRLAELSDVANFIRTRTTAPPTEKLDLLSTYVRQFAMRAVRRGPTNWAKELRTDCEEVDRNLSDAVVRVCYRVPVLGLDMTVERVSFDDSLSLERLDDVARDALVSMFQSIAPLSLDFCGGAVVLTRNEPFDKPDERSEAIVVVDQALAIAELMANSPLVPLGVFRESLTPFAFLGTSSFQENPRAKGWGGLQLDATIGAELRSGWESFKLNFNDHVAFSRFSSALRATTDADRVLDLWIALESAFSGNQATEISHRLSIRIPLYVGELGERRSACANLVKKSYSLRSKIVHGALHKPLNKNEVDLVDATQRLLRSALQRMLKDGRIDADEFEQRCLDSIGAIDVTRPPG